MKRAGASWVIAVTMLAGCGFTGDAVRVGALPYCDDSSRGRLILMAQSVPSATLIPCLEDLPDGWQLEHADADSHGSRMRFDDSSGTEVVVALSPACEPEGERVATRAGVDTYVTIDGSGRVEHRVFTGGCIRLEIPPGEQADLMARSIGMIERDRLRSLSGWTL